jgi:lactoylglutathione lyase
MFKQIDYTMIIVSDMERSVEFYRDKLGIPLKFQSPDWTEFATGTTTLALHGGGVRAEHPPTGDPSKAAGACSMMSTKPMKT